MAIQLLKYLTRFKICTYAFYTDICQAFLETLAERQRNNLLRFLKARIFREGVAAQLVLLIPYFSASKHTQNNSHSYFENTYQDRFSFQLHFILFESWRRI